MIKLGIIGAGRMGQLHAENLLKIEAAKVVAVCDPLPENAKKLASKLDCKTYANGVELLDDPSVDAVLICVPTPGHHQLVLQAMERKKHVFCEKPLARTLEQGREMIAAWKKSQVTFAVGFVRRYAWACRQIKKMIDEKVIGIPQIGRVSLILGVYRRQRGDWFADFDACGGVILDMMAHSLDLLHWYFGSADRVSAEGWLLSPTLPDPADYFSSTLLYSNRVIGRVEGGWLRVGEGIDRMDIHGDKGQISFDWGNPDVLNLTLKDRPTETLKRPADAPDKPFLEEMKDFVESAAKKRQPKVTIENGMQSLETALAIIQSIQNEQTIRLR
ncbi:MAG: Gfo/Idh/MocA family oxidoreductase [Verrucomicrobiae bacterium]|nr:Gfo/Idh/MocA family oxidoreductase [Verrucomicrobiae bacterium]